jgi:hypothetical protein
MTWKAQTLLSGSPILTGISWASTADCRAVGLTASGNGAAVATTDGGATWNPQTVPSGIINLSGVSSGNTADWWAIGISGSDAVILNVGQST